MNQKFEVFMGALAPLDKSHVDTDQIIPKQYLKSLNKSDFGQYLFDAWRYLDEGDLSKTIEDRNINTDFILNYPEYKDASILLARENFGCGSSREHAVWALKEYGFRCVIAESFSDIFYENCFNNGVLAIALSSNHIDSLFTYALSNAKEAKRLQIDLKEQLIQSVEGGKEQLQIPFDVPPAKKKYLMQGLDRVDQTLLYKEQILAYEQKVKERYPWIF